MVAKRITVHCVDIENKPGSLQKFLAQSALSGVDYECFAAFACEQNRGRLYLISKHPSGLEAFAAEAGLDISTAAGFLLGGPDQVGAAAETLREMAEADVNAVAGCAMAHDGQFGMLVVVDQADADKAAAAMGL